MTRPPETIDDATVLLVADLSDAIPTGKTRHVVDGRTVERFAAVAIAQYDRDDGVYLFYCDGEWNSVTDTYHDDVESAVAQAEFEFGPLKFAPLASSSGPQ